MVITTTALVASPDGDQDPSNELWAFKSAHVTGSHRRILSRVALQDGSSRLQTPAPSLAPAAQTPLPRPPLLLRRGCTASVAVLASAFCSHGKPASFFANLYNAISLPLWLSVPASPTQPRELPGRLRDPRRWGGRGVSLPGPHSSWKPNAHTGPLKVTLKA